VVEHSLSEVGNEAKTHTEEAESPEEAAEDHEEDDEADRFADVVEEEVEVKGEGLYTDRRFAVGHSVDDEIVDLGDFQLTIVHGDEGEKPKQQCEAVFQIIAVDVFSEYHSASAMKDYRVILYIIA
jgi:hypothetical protein